MSNELSKRDEQINFIKSKIRTLENKIATTGDEDLKKATFMSVACMAISGNDKLLKCSIPSIQRAVMQAATDGLLLDGNEAALVPYGDTAKYMPMVQGIIKKAKMHGDVRDIRAKIVYRGDVFVWEEGDEQSIKHRPTLDEQGEIIAAYCIVDMRDGSKKRLVMSKAEIEKIRQSSKAKDTVWASWWESMAKKTLIRQMSKELNLSPNVLKIIKNVDQYYDMEKPSEEKEVNKKPEENIALYKMKVLHELGAPQDLPKAEAELLEEANQAQATSQ